MRESDITETCPPSIARKHDTLCMGTDFQRNRSRDDRNSIMKRRLHCNFNQGCDNVSLALTAEKATKKCTERTEL